MRENSEYVMPRELMAEHAKMSNNHLRPKIVRRQIRERNRRGIERGLEGRLRRLSTVAASFEESSVLVCQLSSWPREATAPARKRMAAQRLYNLVLEITIAIVLLCADMLAMCQMSCRLLRRLCRGCARHARASITLHFSSARSAIEPCPIRRRRRSVASAWRCVGPCRKYTKPLCGK